MSLKMLQSGEEETEQFRFRLKVCCCCCCCCLWPQVFLPRNNCEDRRCCLFFRVAVQQETETRDWLVYKEKQLLGNRINFENSEKQKEALRRHESCLVEVISPICYDNIGESLQVVLCIWLRISSLKQSGILRAESEAILRPRSRLFSETHPPPPLRRLRLGFI